jgi:hypothetical protein
VFDLFSTERLYKLGEEGGSLSMVDDMLYITGHRKLTAWKVNDLVHPVDEPPRVVSQIGDLDLEVGDDPVVINLQDVFSDQTVTHNCRK